MTLFKSGEGQMNHQTICICLYLSVSEDQISVVQRDAMDGPPPTHRAAPPIL